MPNSDGAPILDDTCSLRGVHIGTCYLSDEVDAQNQASIRFDGLLMNAFYHRCFFRSHARGSQDVDLVDCACNSLG